MKTTTSPLLPAALSVAAAVLVGGLAFFLRERLGPWQFAFYCGGLLALGGGLLPHPRRLRGWAGRLCGRSAPGDSGREQDSPAEELPRELAALLDERLRAVEQRERELADRLAAYHEWFEFPPPIRLGESRPPTAEMWERDRRLADLLEERTRSAFEKVRQNAYSPGGEFDAKLVRDDVLELVTAIARLYGRDPENPIAGVSVERILRAASRCCLKFLNELETLPLDVRHYDLATVYGYVRQAVRVYGLYQSASPFMPWLARAYYGTRFAMGANPLALGVWWFAGAVGKRGATALAVKLANRWALAFLHDIVRVIGFEMASVYDAGFRYRDPNWCYAAELTELVRRFPGSESSLRGALGQIGSLQLRNEYDRIYFFRCLAEGKSPDFTRISRRPSRPSSAGRLPSGSKRSWSRTLPSGRRRPRSGGGRTSSAGSISAWRLPNRRRRARRPIKAATPSGHSPDTCWRSSNASRRRFLPIWRRPPWRGACRAGCCRRCGKTCATTLPSSSRFRNSSPAAPRQGLRGGPGVALGARGAALCGRG